MTERTDLALGGPNVPDAARWLGGLGAIPFVSLALAGSLLEAGMRAQAVYALAVYGAVILSFLGGIQWGLAIATDDGSLRRLGLSVVPPLVAWAGLLLPLAQGMILLAISFACVLLVDLQASRAGEAPAWYPKLRWPLTIAAAASLIVGIFFG